MCALRDRSHGKFGFQISSRKISRENFYQHPAACSLAGERAEVAQIRKRIHRNIARCKRGNEVSLLRMKRICTGAPVLFCQTPPDRTILKRLRNRAMMITIFQKLYRTNLCLRRNEFFFFFFFSFLEEKLVKFKVIYFITFVQDRYVKG